MADEHPTGDTCLMPLFLAPAQITLMRQELGDWLGGVQGDLETPDKLADPERTRAEAAAYERLLAGLAAGRLTVPDESAREFLRAAADSYDAENGYAEVLAHHDAMRALLAALEPRAGRFEATPECAAPASPEEREAQRRVLDLIVDQHPEPLTFPALGARLMDGPGDFAAGYSLACAARDLVSAGLLQSDGLHVTPTRAALHFAQLRPGR